MLAPVNVFAMLKLSVRNASSALGCFGAGRGAAVQSASTFSFQSRLTARATRPCFCATKWLMFVGVFHGVLSFRISEVCKRLYWESF